MHEDHRDLPGLVRPAHVEGGVQTLLVEPRVEQAGPFQHRQPAPCQQCRQGRGAVARQVEQPLTHRFILDSERVNQLERGPARTPLAAGETTGGFHHGGRAGTQVARQEFVERVLNVGRRRVEGHHPVCDERHAEPRLLINMIDPLHLQVSHDPQVGDLVRIQMHGGRGQGDSFLLEHVAPVASGAAAVGLRSPDQPRDSAVVDADRQVRREPPGSSSASAARVAASRYHSGFDFRGCDRDRPGSSKPAW